MFLDELAAHGIDTRRADRARLGRSSSTAAQCKVTHPPTSTSCCGRSPTRRAYLDEYRRDWADWLTHERASWSHERRDLVAELAPWFEPLLERAPITSAGVAGNVVIDIGDPSANVCIDFVESEVRPWRGETVVYRITSTAG